MSLYDVDVFTKVRETYCVEAATPEEAAAKWMDGDLVGSECIEVEDVAEAKKVDE
ncbi:hypothetical protein SEA_ECLIPTUS_103 [Gordonia phage Ecliptus]|uniref:Uncharacterized protein n=2 Tax=Caudoviricetes TaxID=2731619 RepID=A0A345L1A2_9CAUD|nr:hypothetical protein HOT72_gp095 [Gordonia phage Apricot]YP_009808333.1 hypothetical protein HOT93_gp054 [Gordonia phage Horus]QYC53762.1 hypothetical protein SEA_LEROY_96 [Gordonia phage Leroy]UTN91558.1 hypothetical protein SEA_PERIWINKLE_104 [Gordonia phage Periwinkle]WAB10668.1 hypothetical protein SEA_ECLIPTUS_103 [Gordonia phage Ecliptus]WNM69802.1 hypothetical protein SEA_CRATER_95 [Gordonia phage Crater]AXH49054.1 hypothetical protein SEA_APRICOT_95 [Gordonia phage Apricot]